MRQAISGVYVSRLNCREGHGTRSNSTAAQAPVREEGENLKAILEADEHSHDNGMNNGKH